MEAYARRPDWTFFSAGQEQILICTACAQYLLQTCACDPLEPKQVETMTEAVVFHALMDH